METDEQTEFVPTVVNQVVSHLSWEDVPAGEDILGLSCWIGPDSGPQIVLTVEEGVQPEWVVALGQALLAVYGG